MPTVRIKIHEFNQAAHDARQPLPVLDTIEVELKASPPSDEAKTEAKAAVAQHTQRLVRTISNTQGGAYAAIVSPSGG